MTSSDFINCHSPNTRSAGAYDIIAKVNAESSRITGLDIKKLDRIQSTLTLIVNEDL